MFIINMYMIWVFLSPVDALMNRRMAGTSLGIMGWNYFLSFPEGWSSVSLSVRVSQDARWRVCVWMCLKNKRPWARAEPISFSLCVNTFLVNSEAFACLLHDVSMAPCWLLNWIYREVFPVLHFSSIYGIQDPVTSQEEQKISQDPKTNRKSSVWSSVWFLAQFSALSGFMLKKPPREPIRLPVCSV